MGVVMKNFIEESKNESIDDSKYYWKNSYFEFLKPLSLDERGKWGENLSHKIMLNAGLEAYWDGDNNIDKEDGIYDIWTLCSGWKKRIEVKTAMRGTTTVSWQHENIYGSPDIWDKLIFLDLDYNEFYLTIFDYDEMVWDKKNPLIGKKPTLRKDSIDAYKVDMSGTSIKNTLFAGLTFSHTIGDDLTPLCKFMREKIEN